LPESPVRATTRIEVLSDPARVAGGAEGTTLAAIGQDRPVDDDALTGAPAVLRHRNLSSASRNPHNLTPHPIDACRDTGEHACAPPRPVTTPRRSFDSGLAWRCLT
jgi:hypothetical protein